MTDASSREYVELACTGGSIVDLLGDRQAALIDFEPVVDRSLRTLVDRD